MSVFEVDYAKHAVEWALSKLSQKAYCRSHDLNYCKFIAARSKLQASKGLTRTNPKFVEVKPKSITDSPIKKHESSSLQPLSIKFPNGATLAIPLTLSPEQYSNVCIALKVLL